jgi:hypothetical protein
LFLFVKNQIQEQELKHKKEFEQMKYVNNEELDQTKSKFESEISKIRVEHETKLEKIKSEYEIQIQNLKNSLDTKRNNVEEFMHSDERDILSVSNENCQKLKDQIKLTKKLDQDLIETLNTEIQQKQQKNNENHNQVPSDKREILNKIDCEGVMLLSLSECLKLKSHFASRNDSLSDIKLKNLDDLNRQNEKNKLLDEIYKLRDLISQMNRNDSSKNSEWRNSLYNTICSIFNDQKEFLINELRTLVLDSTFDLDFRVQLGHLESKLDDLTRLHKKSIEYLQSSDRESLLDELKQVKEELNKILDDLGGLQDQVRQYNRELKLMEYAKDAEQIKCNDLRQSLNQEKTKSLDLMDKLNQEKKRTNSMQEQLSDLNDELMKIKEMLDAESKNFQLICKELENERSKNQQLKQALIAHQQQESTSNKHQKSCNDENRTSSSSKYLKTQNSNSKLSQIEQVCVDLEQQLCQEKLKNERLLKQNQEIKNQQLKYSNIEAFNSTNHNLERIRQALEFIAIKQKDELDSNKSTSFNNINSVKLSLSEIIKELETCQLNTSIQLNHNLLDTNNIRNESSSNNNNNELETKLIQQNRDLINTIKKLTNDKSELRNFVIKQEEELSMLKQRVKNQNQSENHSLSEHDREKFKRLYYKYLKAESFRKSLIYQKKFLLIMLSGYEETEREIMSTLRLESSTMHHHHHNHQHKVSSKSCNNNYQYLSTASSMISSPGINSSISHHQQLQQHRSNQNGVLAFNFSSKFMTTTNKAKSRFRKAAICVIAISRIRFLQRKHSHMLTRVDTYHRN